MARVEVKEISIDFPVYGVQRSLRKALFERAAGGLIRRTGPHQTRTLVNALDRVSLTLEDGDRVGIVGHNGAGKTTLLKAIAGIYEPIVGEVRIEGKVTPLFDVLPGLDFDDTGYENIVTAGILLGMARRDIKVATPEIEAFSELGDYLALPVRTYSEGMVTRLGFSVATTVEPGILLIDEGIATGDARFGERATQRMTEFIGRSSILVLASHDEDFVRHACNKAVLMSAGRIVEQGTVDDVLCLYRESRQGDADGARPQARLTR